MEAVLEQTSKPRKRKLDDSILPEIASMIEDEKLTEAEACRILGIEPQQWYCFKSRKRIQPKFESICTRIRGGTIREAMQRLRKAGEDQDIELPNGRIITKRGDWRADHARLALIAPERFGQQAGSQDARPANTLSDASMRLILDKVFNQPSQAVVDCEPVKAINDIQST